MTEQKRLPTTTDLIVREMGHGQPCGPGWETIHTAEECRKAAETLGETYRGLSAHLAAFPGCIMVNNHHIRFNTGSGTDNQRICKLTSTKQIETKETLNRNPKRASIVNGGL
jgi:hypothetical protein